MRRRALVLIMLCFVLSGAITTAYAADAEAYNDASVLYNLGLFSGTGTKADGSPNFDLDRTPTRHEGITMLVSLLGKKEEALAGAWEMPFTDVADWAKPFVGYAYAHGLTSGTSDTTYSGNLPLTAAQYFTFVLKALGFETGADFQWDKSYEFAHQIGLADARYKTDKDFLRGDVSIISRNAMEVKQKGSQQTLAEKLISEKVFTKDAYKLAVESPLILQEPVHIVPDVAFSINGSQELITSNSTRADKGTYIVTPYLRGERFNDFEVQVERGTGTVTKNSDGTFTIEYPAKDNFSIALFYDPVEIVTVNPDGTKSISWSWTKRSLAFNTPIPRDGFVLARGSSTIYPDGRYFGDNFSSYFVVDVYFNGVRLNDYAVTAATDAPFTAHIQADGSLLLMKIGDGRGKFTITYQGQSATFGATML